VGWGLGSEEGNGAFGYVSEGLARCEGLVRGFG
jgi:hypothetical protein